jgi:hypothetical protein
MKVAGKDDLGVEIEFDVRLNNVLEEEMISALHGEDEEHLKEMAEAHIEKMTIIQQAQERAREAAQAVASRADAEAAFSSSWNDPYSDSKKEEWDSDTDYDSEGDMY